MDLLKQLQDMRGHATCMISLLISSNGNLCISRDMIQTEYGTATHIKDKNTRKSVLDSLKSIQHKLKGFKQLPSTGLAIFAGYYV